MLTFDLLMASSQRGSAVRPLYVDTKDTRLLARVELFVGIFKSSVGQSRSDLKSELDAQLTIATRPLVEKGWVKLLLDRCRFEIPTDLDVADLRKRVFLRSSAGWRDGSWDGGQVLAEVSSEVDLPRETIEALLYADLKDEERVISFDPVSAERLLERYNLALAQAVLFKAVRIRIELGKKNAPSALRSFFRALKFHRLLHSTDRPSGRDLVVVVDGPLSLFGLQSRYGVRMASLLPHLVPLKNWVLEAELAWGTQRTAKTFRVDPGVGLKSHVRASSFVPDELQAFKERFDKLASAWDVSEETPLIDLGSDGVVIPDFRFVHRTGGQTVDFEVLGYWHKASVEERLAKLRKSKGRWILGASSELALEPGADLPGEIVRFRQIPNAPEILKLLEASIDNQTLFGPDPIR